MVTTKINIKPHLAEYCIGKWGNEFKEPVRFPRSTDLYVTLYNLTKKRPDNCRFDSGNLEVILPSSTEKDDDLEVRKNPAVYNYLSERSCIILERKIESQFWSEAHQVIDDNKNRYGIKYIDSVCELMNKYRITSITEDAIIKNYMRWKENIRKRKKRAYKKENIF